MARGAQKRENNRKSINRLFRNVLYTFLPSDANRKVECKDGAPFTRLTHIAEQERDREWRGGETKRARVTPRYKSVKLHGRILFLYTQEHGDVLSRYFQSQWRFEANLSADCRQFIRCVTFAIPDEPEVTRR